MNAQRPPRQPLTEFVLIGIGAVLFALARLLDLDALFIGSIFLCMFAGLAALFSSKLGQQSLRMKLAATGIGLAATGLPPVWLTSDL